jgi:hypothetical protein
MLPSRTFPVSAIFFVGADAVNDGLMLPSRTRAVSAILADGRREAILTNFFFILRPPVIVTEDRKRNVAADRPNNFLAIRMKMLWIDSDLWKSLCPEAAPERRFVGTVGGCGFIHTSFQSSAVRTGSVRDLFAHRDQSAG